jgi:2-phospho-L-lactate transferase/gluconeogenesis factor (CofD/UPF0052 family)
MPKPARILIATITGPMSLYPVATQLCAEKIIAIVNTAKDADWSGSMRSDQYDRDNLDLPES